MPKTAINGTPAFDIGVSSVVETASWRRLETASSRPMISRTATPGKTGTSAADGPPLVHQIVFKFSTMGYVLHAVAIAEKSVSGGWLKIIGKYMHQEAPQEFIRGQSHQLLLVLVLVLRN